MLPVKLRIHTDIQQRAPGVFTRKSLSMFLHRHTTSTAYIKALLAASTRFDLDGQPAGEIAEEHRAAAVTELDRRKAIVQEKRAAQHRAGPGAQRHTRAPGQPQRAQGADGGEPGGTTLGAQDGADQGPQADRPVAADRAAGAPGTEHPRPPRSGPRPNNNQPDGRRNEARRSPAGAPGRPPRGPRPNPDFADGAAGRPARPSSTGFASSDAPASAHPRPAASNAAGGRRPDARSPNPAAAQLAPPQADTSADPARRERGALLRSFEGSTLTKANFLVLKRMTEADLDAQLTLARQERQEWQAQHPAPPRPERAPGGPGRR